MIPYAPLIVLFPLVGFLLIGLAGWKYRSERLIGIVGSGVVGLSFALAVGVVMEMAALPVDARRWTVEVFPWIDTFTGTAGSFGISVAYQFDQLSMLMTLVVTGVGFLIHVYSIGYMHGDAGYWRFFAYMNLFIFMMLNLVLADNFLLMFLGWEGVGLCSYLLIGFWYEKTFTGDAGKKAFIVNRIGDFGFLLGMLLIFKTFGSLEFTAVMSGASVMTAGSAVTFWIGLLLFIGATGKSAQIPLFVWLPDAMAGPTPVSALIHAATMVTAGVYMVARCAPLYALAPDALLIVAIVGAVTAVFAATIGLVQNDIKKVLAYSTVSQLGYMFLATGVAAFGAGIFHVMTHAFFKALLFLGSGAVIHGMHEEQDIQKMGGLKKYMPVTWATFLIGAIAIAGIPPFAGFFSKDEILWYAFSSDLGSPALWVLGALGALMTAFYMFRLVYLTFYGKERFDHHHLHPHEAPKTMTVPLMLLAFLSVVGGFLGVPAALGGGNIIGEWLEPVFAPAHRTLMLSGHGSHTAEYLLMAVSVLVAGAGIYLARRWYLEHPEVPNAIAARFAGVYRVLWNKYYVDEAYDAAVVRPIQKTSDAFLWKVFDVKIIDGAVNGSGWLAQTAATWLRRVQTGVAQSYAVILVGGILVVVSALLFF
jgi:NADH-quinone oxidoreductase subunit L